MVEVSKPPSCVLPCKHRHILYLCERMRPDEIEQYVKLSGLKAYDPELAAQTFINMPGMKFTVIGRDGYPAACGGYVEKVPGVMLSWMVGSMDGWNSNWRSITKACRWLMDGLFEMGARRLETLVLASRTEACGWYMKGLGMAFEGLHPGYASDGAPAATYARVKLQPAEAA